MFLGLDFDNTLIHYDTLFHRVAHEQGLIPADFPVHKNRVRDYLRGQDREDEWTRMQGEIYGRRIAEAVPYAGMHQALHALGRADIPMCIVSHKTRIPYRGPAYDLHQAARDWLTGQGFFSPTGLGWSPEQVYFELTKEAKVQRIATLGCTHYVDDLPEILDLLPANIHKILFVPTEANVAQPDWTILRAWADLPDLLQIQVGRQSLTGARPRDAGI